MSEKKCFKCEQVKNLGEFYVHPGMADGHLNKCKECTKRDVSSNYRKRREQCAKYERRRGRTDKRRRASSMYQERRRKRNPQVYRARYITTNAIRDGRLQREPCEVCGSTEVEAHHDDYQKPLSVRWLCRKHHLVEHGKQAYEF